VIVNVGSVIGKVGGAGQANYKRLKGGVGRSDQIPCKGTGLPQCAYQCRCTGFIETEMTDVLKPEYRDLVLKQIPLGCFGKAEDVAR